MTTRFLQIGSLAALLILTLAACGTSTTAEVEKLGTTNWVTLRSAATGNCLIPRYRDRNEELFSSYNRFFMRPCNSSSDAFVFRVDDWGGTVPQFLINLRYNKCVRHYGPDLKIDSCSSAQEPQSREVRLINNGDTYTFEMYKESDEGKQLVCINSYAQIAKCNGSDNQKWHLDMVWRLAGN